MCSIAFPPFTFFLPPPLRSTLIGLFYGPFHFFPLIKLKLPESFRFVNPRIHKVTFVCYFMGKGHSGVVITFVEEEKKQERRVRGCRDQGRRSRAETEANTGLHIKVVKEKLKRGIGNILHETSLDFATALKGRENRIETIFKARSRTPIKAIVYDIRALGVKTTGAVYKIANVYETLHLSPTQISSQFVCLSRFSLLILGIEMREGENE